MSDATLLERFLSSLAADARAAMPAELAATLADRLQRVVRTTKERWPDIDIAEGDFAAHVASLASAETDWKALLDAERGADVYLAYGCVRGDKRALSYFEAHYMSTLKIVWRRGGTVALDDDDRQTLRERLLVARGDRGPRIGEYAGRGSLRNWVRIVTLRQLSTSAERINPEIATDEEFFTALAAAGDDLQVEYTKVLYRFEFQEAFAQALAMLADRDRNLLRYAVVKGLTLDELAIVFAVHRATIARWLVEVRATLAKELRKALRARLAVGEAEVDSILRLIESQVDLTLERHLAESASIAMANDGTTRE